MKLRKYPQRVSHRVWWHGFSETQREAWSRWFGGVGYPPDVVAEFTVRSHDLVEADVYHLDDKGQKHVASDCGGSARVPCRHTIKIAAEVPAR